MDDIIKEAVSKFQLPFGLKPEQERCIKLLLEDKHVLAVLPTGYGKSLIYSLFPYIKSQIKGSRCTGLVISPLNALMEEQVSVLTGYGLTACALKQDTPSDVHSLILSGDVDLILASPESIVQTHWLDAVLSIREQLCCLTFDEAHCISTWGLDFRPSYRRVVELISEMPNIPTLLLSATTTQKVKDDLFSLLALEDDSCSIVSVLPDRPNIFIHFEKVVENFEEALSWLVPYLTEKQHISKKILIYCHTVRAVFKIFMWLCEELELGVFMGRQQKADNRLVEMFHSKLDEQSKSRVIESFSKSSGSLRVVVSTVAFGIGIDVKDVDIVIHWGVEPSALTYWQELGRCARDGREGVSICYSFAASENLVKEDDPMKLLISAESCYRELLLKQFDICDIGYSAKETLCQQNCEIPCKCNLCKCCSNCIKKCDCKGKEMCVCKRYIL